ncbi:MAG TPA: hypothetical protein VI776_02200 [Anaerolineales bacterium]|nr:hypothetical protein [Anaerolineales bacterium]
MAIRTHQRRVLALEGEIGQIMVEGDQAVQAVVAICAIQAEFLDMPGHKAHVVRSVACGATIIGGGEPIFHCMAGLAFDWGDVVVHLVADQAEIRDRMIEVGQRSQPRIEPDSPVIRVAASAFLDSGDPGVHTCLNLDLIPDCGVAAQAEYVLGGPQGLVAQITLLLEIVVTYISVQLQVGQALGAQSPGAEKGEAAYPHGDCE